MNCVFLEKEDCIFEKFQIINNVRRLLRMTFAGLEQQDDVSGLLTGEENKDRLERKKECRDSR